MALPEISIDKFIGLENIEIIADNPGEYETLFSDKFALVDLDISARVLMHWSKSGLLPDKEKEGRKHKFNFFELIYLYILQDLRDIGYSIERIKSVKQQLLTKFHTKDLITLISGSSIDELEKHGYDVKLFRLILKNKEEIIQQSDELPEWISRTDVLTNIILSALIQKLDIRLVIMQNGIIHLQHPNQHGMIPVESYSYSPHIVIPLIRYLTRFISISKYAELVTSFNILNERELFILKLVREGKYKEVSIRFGNKEEMTLTMTEEIKAQNATRLSEILAKGEYQDLQVKSQEGTVSYSTLTTKKKFI